jgi:hypothetical protein
MGPIHSDVGIAITRNPMIKSGFVSFGGWERIARSAGAELADPILHWLPCKNHKTGAAKAALWFIIFLHSNENMFSTSSGK